jgi:hypothetical protein
MRSRCRSRFPEDFDASRVTISQWASFHNVGGRRSDDPVGNMNVTDSPLIEDASQINPLLDAKRINQTRPG